MTDPLRALPAAYGPLCERLLAELEADARVLRVTFGGSLASGTADAWSDLDVVVHVDDPAGFDAREAIRRATPTVILREMPFGATAVTPEWLRLDVVVRRPDEVKPPERPAPNAAELVEELFRVLGLLPTVVGRGELVIGSDGVFLLRSLLVRLLHIANGLQSDSGVKRLNAYLTPEQRTMLEALPPISAHRDSVIEGHLAVAGEFLPRARALLESWPHELESATLAHLARELPEYSTRIAALGDRSAG